MKIGAGFLKNNHKKSPIVEGCGFKFHLNYWFLSYFSCVSVPVQANRARDRFVLK